AYLAGSCVAGCSAPRAVGASGGPGAQPERKQGRLMPSPPSRRPRPAAAAAGASPDAPDVPDVPGAPGSAGALLPEEDAYRLVFDNAGVGIFKSTPEGRYLMVNPALAELLGFESVAAMMRADIHELYADPRRREEFKALIARDGKVRNFVIEAKRIDGAHIWISETVTLVRGTDGGPAYYIGTTVDITRQVEASLALAAAERDYREIFEHATIGIYRSSIDGRQLRANPALVRLNGYRDEAEQLAAVHDIGAEWYVDPGRRTVFVERLLADGRVEDFVSEVYRHRTRERIWVSETARLVRDEAGNPLYFEGTVQDITDQVRAREELIATRSEAEVMEQEVFGPLGSARYRGYLTDIRASGLHLLQLLDDILDLSKVEAGKLELEERPCDLFAIFEEAARMLETLAARNGVTLSLQGAGRLPAFLGDPRRLRQIALNLLSNAVKYNRRGGRVEVAMEPEPDGGLRVTVADTGLGIAPEDQARVFEPFTQLNRAQSDRQEGTGLGLPLCRQLVELHGGRLRLDSRLGEGTRVAITLPAAR
ncbi:pleC, partial [Symbiodinium necroappetens]